MKNLHRFSFAFFLGMGSFFFLGGCGSSDNTVVEPAEYTPEQVEDMKKEEEQMKAQGGRGLR